MAENSKTLDPEKKEARMLTLALRYLNGYECLLNWDLAQAMAKEAQEFYEYEPVSAGAAAGGESRPK